jgi:hypothetical protein
MPLISAGSEMGRRAWVLIAALAVVALIGRPSVLRGQVSSLAPVDAGTLIRSQPGARVVLLYSTSCRTSHEMFPEVVRLAERYSPLGVTFLAFSIDEDPAGIEEYLGSVGYIFGRLHIQRSQPGDLVAALEPSGIDVRSGVFTPHIAVIDAHGQLVGQHQGGWGAQKANRWLRSLGFNPASD